MELKPTTPAEKLPLDQADILQGEFSQYDPGLVLTHGQTAADSLRAVINKEKDEHKVKVVSGGQSTANIDEQQITLF